jgi:enoyl-CoA hydratase/carnithine racemase
VSDKKVLYDKDGSIRIITLNFPERRNAYNTLLLEHAVEAIEEFQADDDASVAVITGAGKGFCSGFDFKEGEEIKALPAAERDERQARWKRAQARFVELVRRDGPKPFVTAINGAAIGGGIQVALSGWLRVMAEDAYLRELSLGFGQPGFIHSPIAPKFGTLAQTELLPPAIEHELLLGMPVAAERAYQVGLVNRVTPADQVMELAVKFAHLIDEIPAESRTALLESVRQRQPVLRPDA